MKTLRGVEGVAMDVGRKTVQVTFDPAVTDLGAIRSQIRLAEALFGAPIAHEDHAVLARAL